jgi:biotin carboxylase
MNLKGKRLLVLTGCNGASDIIRYARSKGAYTIASDFHDVSDVKDMADERVNVSTTDIAALEAIAAERAVDGITTGTSESSMFSVLALTARLQLPFYSTEEQLGVINNKKRFKDWLHAFDVPVPQEYSVDDVSYPAVVKPVDSSGAKGISICRADADLRAALELARQHSRLGEVVVERYVAASSEVFFNYTLIDGRISLSCAFDTYKHHQAEGIAGVLALNLYPSRHLQKYIDTTHPRVVAALTGLGLRNGVVSIQTLFDGEQFFVFEAGFRLGGAQSYVFTKHLNGLSHMEMMVNHALTGRMADDEKLLDRDDPFFKQPCCQLNLPLRSGSIATFDGLNSIRNLSGVLNVTQVRMLGDTVIADSTTNQLGVRVHVVGSSLAELSDTSQRIRGTLDIRDADGKDMVLDAVTTIGDHAF